MTPKEHKMWDEYMAKISKLDWATIAVNEKGDTSVEAAQACAERTRLVKELTEKLTKESKQWA